MEIQKFEKDRNNALASFEKSFDALKTEYSSRLLSAIQEGDPVQQQAQISNVLSINSEMVSQLNTIISQLSQGSNAVSSKTMDELTKDLVKYQTEYNQIQESKNKLETLKRIYATSQEKLKTINFMYNLYLGVLVFLCIVVLYYAFSTTSVSVITQAVSSVVAPLTPTQ
jgi:hypothetical protein